MMRKLRSARYAVAAVAVLVQLAAAPSLAAPCTSPGPELTLSMADTERLESLDMSRTRGLAEALTAESADERAAVAALFSRGFAPVDAESLPGAYRCRTLKLGGLGPLVVYSWFRCSVEADGERFAIRKETGSQNFTGTLFPAGNGYLFRGASFYNDDPATAYGDSPETDTVGCLGAVGESARHFILELPFPLLESTHDVIELVPAQ